MYKLYVFLRSDLESLTPGKAAAQVAHAASQAAAFMRNLMVYKNWELPYGFGTTVVLDGGSFEGGESFFSDLEQLNEVHRGTIVDPTYPLRDGRVTHLLNLTTCHWLFTDTAVNVTTAEFVSKFRLYHGNHD